jgi:hypothetical protein
MASDEVDGLLLPSRRHLTITLPRAVTANHGVVVALSDRRLYVLGLGQLWAATVRLP